MAPILKVVITYAIIKTLIINYQDIERVIKQIPKNYFYSWQTEELARSYWQVATTISSGFSSYIKLAYCSSA